MSKRAASPDETIAFQGLPGAYSHLACREALPDMEPMACRTFRDAFAAVREGRARLAMIPIENSVAGRVADIHHLLPDSGLHIIGEHFARINHHLLAVKGTDIGALTHVHSHIHALNQCRGMIAELGIEPVEHVDTAGAAAEVAAKGHPSQAAIASGLAAEIYDLESLRENIEDAEHNTTRFIIMSKREERPPVESAPSEVITSFVFRVRNVPAALFKAMGGFATNGINMTKLESYIGEGFFAAQFYADVEGHPDHRNLKLAFEELGFFTHDIRVLGVYPAHSFRAKVNGPAS